MVKEVDSEAGFNTGMRENVQARGDWVLHLSLVSDGESEQAGIPRLSIWSGGDGPGHLKLVTGEIK